MVARLPLRIRIARKWILERESVLVPQEVLVGKFLSLTRILVVASVPFAYSLLHQFTLLRSWWVCPVRLSNSSGLCDLHDSSFWRSCLHLCFWFLWDCYITWRPTISWLWRSFSLLHFLAIVFLLLLTLQISAVLDRLARTQAPIVSVLVLQTPQALVKVKGPVVAVPKDTSLSRPSLLVVYVRHSFVARRPSSNSGVHSRVSFTNHSSFTPKPLRLYFFVPNTSSHYLIFFEFESLILILAPLFITHLLPQTPFVCFPVLLSFSNFYSNSVFLAGCRQNSLACSSDLNSICNSSLDACVKCPTGFSPNQNLTACSAGSASQSLFPWNYF